MSNNTLKTDPRLLAIIDGGRRFSEIIDPEGILTQGQIIRLSIDTKSSKWKTKYVFPNGDTLHAVGSFDKEYNPTVVILKMPSQGNSYENISIKPSKTVFESLGNLAGVPARLRRCLVSTAPDGGKDDKSKSFVPIYLDILNSALSWEVVMKPGENTLVGFHLYKIDFQQNERGQITQADFSVTNSLENGEITISAEADIYGLSKKKVTLKKNLGMNRTAVVECNDKTKKRVRASLMVAYDLYNLIPVIYEAEITNPQRIDNGVKKMKSK